MDVFGALFGFLQRHHRAYRTRKLRQQYNIPDSVHLGYPVELGRNVEIGAHTMINSYSQIFSGPKSWVRIGEYCTIGYNVHIKGETHPMENPCAPDRGLVEKDIVIGDRVWLGDNVFVREGVTIGSDVVVGANSVVTKDLPDKVVAAGVPAKVIKKKE